MPLVQGPHFDNHWCRALWGLVGSSVIFCLVGCHWRILSRGVTRSDFLFLCHHQKSRPFQSSIATRSCIPFLLCSSPDLSQFPTLPFHFLPNIPIVSSGQPCSPASWSQPVTASLPLLALLRAWLVLRTLFLQFFLAEPVWSLRVHKLQGQEVVLVPVSSPLLLPECKSYCLSRRPCPLEGPAVWL